MRFELSEDQKAIKKIAEDFASKEFKHDLAYKLEKNHEFPFKLYKQAAELGFVAPYIDEHYGGQGLGILENVIIVEEFCRADSSIGLAIDLAALPSKFILRFGNESQKEKYLPRITKGESGAAIALTEPNHGSDITEINTKAIKKKDHYLVNGSKTFITNGTIADFYTVLCQTDPNSKPKHKGMSILIIERSMKGDHFFVNELGNKLGIRLTSSAELAFDNLKVPLENLLGEENKGFYQTIKFFEESKIEIGAQAVGIAQGAFDMAYKYSMEREQFGRPIHKFQVIEHKFADMYVKIINARNLVYKAAWEFDKGKPSHLNAAIAKFYAAKIANEVTYDALQIFGGYGYFEEYNIERYYRDARILTIYEGTEEIQKNIIAGSLFSKR